MSDDGQHGTVARHAILIGINAYPNEPLKGCVRDVQNIKTYLEGESNSIHIRMFTATESDRIETEDQTLRPTYQNITRAFEETTNSANPGDLIYIHFSGHGTRCEPYASYSNQSMGDLALVLLSGGEQKDEIYLYGPRLARALKPMVDKGLVVTLVLDCCFAGSVCRRDDPTIRCIPYDAAADSKPWHPEDDMDDGALRSSRDASMQPNWLMNPNGYTILAACGPHEKATERAFDGQVHGVLSYHLLEKAIKGYGGLGKMHKHIYAYLHAILRHSGWQSPVLYGNKEQGFFEHVSLEASTTAVLSIIEKQEGHLELQAGQAHGILDDDQFELYPLSAAGQASKFKGSTILAKATKVRALTSDLKQLDTTIRARTGWMARPVTRLSLRTAPIRFTDELPHHWEIWQKAFKKRSLAVFIDTDQQPPHAFHVVLNSNKEYEVLDRFDRRLLNVPPMHQDLTDVSDISRVLEHLAKFTLVTELANTRPTSFSQSFRAQIIRREDGVAFDPGCSVGVKHSEKGFTFELRIENQGDKGLYIYLYDMGPFWQVEGISRQTYELLPPKDISRYFSGVFRKKFKTIVPLKMREEGYSECKDIIKVFVTSQPTSFDIWELPEIGESVKEKPTLRTGREEGALSEEWVALNFPICTSFT